MPSAKWNRRHIMVHGFVERAYARRTEHGFSNLYRLLLSCAANQLLRASPWLKNDIRYPDVRAVAPIVSLRDLRGASRCFVSYQLQCLHYVCQLSCAVRHPSYRTCGIFVGRLYLGTMDGRRVDVVVQCNARSVPTGVLV